MKIIGGSVLADTFITSGSGTTWLVSRSQNIPSSTLVGFSPNGYLTSLVSNISLKQTTIADKQTVIADKQTVIADKTTAMETYQKKLKELAEDKGIRIISPYEYLTLIQQYKSLVEEGNILKPPTIQKSATKEAAARINDYIESIKDLPTIKD
jgi:hypothetical protein